MRPRILDTDPIYKGLTPAAKELYTVMFGRTCLSATKGDAYRDEMGVYIIYTVEEAEGFLNCKKEKAMKASKSWKQETERDDIIEEIGQREGELIRQYRPLLNTQIPKAEDWRKWDVKPLNAEEVLKLLLDE